MHVLALIFVVARGGCVGGRDGFFGGGGVWRCHAEFADGFDSVI